MQHTPIARKRRGFLLAVSVCMALLLVPFLAEAKPANKVTICHVPPGNPSNFHTIIISENALAAHLAHGDVEGPCDQWCEQNCVDHNVCTQDVCYEGTLICMPSAERPTVGCNDGDPSTLDFCDGAQGCVNVPNISAESLGVSALGPIEITLRGDTPVGFCSVTTTQECTVESDCPELETCEPANLSFSIFSQPDEGNVSFPPTPIVPNPVGSCSVTNTPCDVAADCPEQTCDLIEPEPFSLCSGTKDPCEVDADCPGDETCDLIVPESFKECSITRVPCQEDSECAQTCEQGQPPIRSALVTYTPPADPGSTETSFEFKVALEKDSGVSATGLVTITLTPSDPESQPPDDPVATVVASDASAQTLTDTGVEVTLTGDAPFGFCSEQTTRECTVESDCPTDETCEPVSLAFSIVDGSGPVFGALSDVIQGSEVPQRTATVIYRPNTGFVGDDSFDFKACGIIAGVEVCDTATATVDINARTRLANDQVVNTKLNQPVIIDLGDVQAAYLFEAAVAWNVADADGDGLGDNSNSDDENFPGVPKFVSASVDTSGGPGSNGTSRIHFEWDISDITADFQVGSATVELHTYFGGSALDTLPTKFYAPIAFDLWDPPTPDGNGTLENSDFETALTEITGVVMPNRAGLSTFSFDVTDHVQKAIDLGYNFFVLQARVNEALSPGSPGQRGMQVFSNCTCSQPLERPQLMVTDEGPISILRLPQTGTLTFEGVPVTVGQTFTQAPKLLYTPALGVSGSVDFEYQVTLGGVTDKGLVEIIIDPDPYDACVPNGREPGCSPGQ